MSESTHASAIRENLARVRERVARACSLAGRPAGDVVITAVTKYVDSDTARLLFQAGCLDLGESRPQVLEEKATALAGSGIRWHLIGHLQRNKVARTIPHTTLIHSVDSLRLAQAIDRAAGQQQRIVEILLEVNISGEAAKHGFSAEELPRALPELQSLTRLRLRGLMGMAGLASNPAETRKQFACLRELRDILQRQVAAEHGFTELSMGMSGDFELAIAEGASIVRIGSLLFAGVL